MALIVLDSADDVANYAAQIIESYVTQHSHPVLGLATGATPLSLYQKLIALHRANGLSFKNVTTFNLDEYLGLQATDRHSYRHYMNSKVFNHIDIELDNTHVPTCLEASDADTVAAEFERKIGAIGPIGLQVLGIGRNGHIGFNEPGASFKSKTRLVQLAPSTITANQPYFDSCDSPPSRAITMGVETIMRAKSILLLATGEHKADAISGAIVQSPSSDCPASALQNHPDVTFIVDRKAALRLIEPGSPLESVTNC